MDLYTLMAFLIDVSSFNPRELYSYRLLIIVVFNPYSLWIVLSDLVKTIVETYSVILSK